MDLLPWYSTNPELASFPVNESEHDISLARYCEALFEESRDDLEKHEEISNIDKAINYLIGRQWTERRPTYKSSPVANRMWTNLVQLVSYLTDIRQFGEVVANNRNYDQQAEILNKMARAWYYNQDIDMTVAMIIIHAALTLGYGRLVWNPELMNGEGEQEITPLGALDLIPIRPGHHLQRSIGVIYRAPKPLSWFREKFPIKGYKVPVDAQYSKFITTTGHPAAGSYGRSWQFLSPQYKRILAQQSFIARESVIPMSLLREFWLRDPQRNTSNQTVYVGDIKREFGYMVEPGEKLYPRGRLICMGGPIVLYDGPNPFWHGQFPFIAMRLNRVPWQWPGISEFRNQMPLQDIMNNVLAGILDMVKKAVNPPLIAPSNSMSAAVMKSIDPNMPNAKIWYSPASMAPPTYQQQPALPGFVFQTMLYAQSELDSQAGFIDLQSVARRGIVPAGDTLEQLKEGQQVMVRLKVRHIEQFHKDMMSQFIPNAYQFYPLARRVMMLGSDGISWEDFDWDPGTMVPAGAKAEDHVRQFAYRVAPGSMLKSSRVPQQQLMLMLRRQGDTDLQTLYEFLDMGNLYAKVKARLEEEGKNVFINMLRNQKAGAAGGGGLSPDILANLGKGGESRTTERPLPITQAGKS